MKHFILEVYSGRCYGNEACIYACFIGETMPKDTMLSFLSVADVAKMLGRSQGAIRQMVWRKQLPHRKVQGRVVFVRSEIEALIMNSPGVRLDEVLQAGG